MCLGDFFGRNYSCKRQPVSDAFRQRYYVRNDTVWFETPESVTSTRKTSLDLQKHEYETKILVDIYDYFKVV